MSANAEVFASLLQKPDLRDEERAAFLWALRQAAESDERGAVYRARVEEALLRFEEAVTAARAQRASQILSKELRESSMRLIQEVCDRVLDEDDNV